jgi:uncharacterized protein (TIGR00369 family)
MQETFEPGERFYDAETPADRDGPNTWKTLGYTRVVWEPGHQVIEWKATEEYGFPTQMGYIVHGGLVSTVLDTAMGGACWSLLDNDQAFLTADLHIEFIRSARPGVLRADGRVVHRASRVVFCEAQLFDPEDSLLARGRCTQVLLPGQGRAGRGFRDPEEPS